MHSLHAYRPTVAFTTQSRVVLRQRAGSAVRKGSPGRQIGRWLVPKDRSATHAPRKGAGGPQARKSRTVCVHRESHLLKYMSS